MFRTDSMEQASLWWSKLERFVGAAGVGEDAEEESPISPSSTTSKEALPGQAVGGGVARQTDSVGQVPGTAAPSATAAPTGSGGHVHATGATTSPTTTAAAAPTKTAT